jgi:hypothetical protein
LTVLAGTKKPAGQTMVCFWQNAIIFAEKEGKQKPVPQSSSLSFLHQNVIKHLTSRLISNGEICQEISHPSYQNFLSIESFPPKLK